MSCRQRLARIAMLVGEGLLTLGTAPRKPSMKLRDRFRWKWQANRYASRTRAQQTMLQLNRENNRVSEGSPLLHRGAGEVYATALSG